MVFRAPTAVYAFVLAAIGGVLLGDGRYVAGAILAVIALVLMGAREIVDRHGDDDRHRLL